MDLNQLITAIVTNGIGAVCAGAMLWLGWYRETKTLPKILETFQTSIENMQSSFELRNTSIVTTFAAVTREERTICQRWHEENRTRLESLSVETRENRHLIRNLAHQLGLAKAVEEEQRRQNAVKEGGSDVQFKG